jgi:hypothetical protein
MGLTWGLRWTFRPRGRAAGEVRSDRARRTRTQRVFVRVVHVVVVVVFGLFFHQDVPGAPEPRAGPGLAFALRYA